MSYIGTSPGGFYTPMYSIDEINSLIPQPNILYTIPLDDKNRHYKEYLKWLANGNTPLPADGDAV